MIKNMQAILLAGGKSTQFKTGKTKLVEKIYGKEMVLYPLEMLQRMHIPTTMVLGYQQERIVQVLEKNNMQHDITFVQQVKQLGTGHAVKTSQPTWKDDHILILNSDIPLLDETVIQKLYNKHTKTDADISFVTSHTSDLPTSTYCKIIINDNKIHVMEPQDYQASSEENMCCISAGIFLIKRSFLEKHIHSLTPSKITGELYLPELVQIASDQNAKVVATSVDFDIVRGVNTLEELWVVEHIKRSQIIRHWMNNGVRFCTTLNVIIDVQATIEPGVYVSPGVHLLGKTTIKKNATLGSFTLIQDSTIGENAHIKSHNVIKNSTIGDNALIQPFSHIHDQNILATPKAPEKPFSPLFTGAIKTDVTEL